MCVGLLMPMHRKGMSTSSTFTNDYSKFKYVYLMHRKSDVLDKFIEFKVEKKTNLVNVSRHFNLLEVESTCLLTLILSSKSTRLYPN